MSLTSLLSTFADETTKNCVNTAIFGEVCDNCNGSAVMQILAYVVRAMTIGVGILAVIGIMVFGIRYLTSRGDENLAIKARRHLFQVLIGIVSYIVLVLTASWILPGNLTATMLGGSPATCPEASKTEITVIEPTPQDQSNPSDPNASTPLSEGWKSGTRPRECGPGTPGDFQTFNKNGITTDKGTFPIYTTSTGRTFVQFNQSGDPGGWGGLLSKHGSRMSNAGCCVTSYAMMRTSYQSADGLYYPAWSLNDDGPGRNAIKYDEAGGGPESIRFYSQSDYQDKISNNKDRIRETIDRGGSILVHACGHWNGNRYEVCNYRSSHYFLLVDYRIRNGTIEYFFLNTNSAEWDGGKTGNGWGTFEFNNNVEDYTLTYRVPKENWDCRVR